MAITDTRTTVRADEWTHNYYLFPRKNLKDAWVRGWLHKRTIEIWDCGHTMQFKYYFTAKDYFKFKLKGLHNK